MRVENLVTWSAPEGISPSPHFELFVDGEAVFVWPARVRAEITMPPDTIYTHEPGCSAEPAAFAIFDTRASVEVKVKPSRAFASASIHPLSTGIVPDIWDGVISFRMEEPRALTILLDGSDESPLHLFASAPETEVPSPDDPSVIYFGPGIHEVDETIELTSGRTLYLAGGALVRAKVPESAKWSRADRIGLQVPDCGPVVSVTGSGARIMGRGILSGELIPHPARNLIRTDGACDASIQGITLLDSPNWNVMIHSSENVRVEDVKIISGRLNSDGINSVNSRNVSIRRCFVRNHDDSIAVKTVTPEGEASGISVEGCTIWNDWGYALGVTYETRAPISAISFRDCDIIFVRHWALGIYMVDSATVSGVRFENIHVEDLGLPSKRFGQEVMLIRVAIMSDMWGTDPDRGRIRDVLFRDISLGGAYSARSEILGFDAEHAVDGVTLEGISYLGQPVSEARDMNLAVNEFARGVEISCLPG